MKRTHIGAQFAVYLVVGGLSTVVDIGGFWLLQHQGLGFWLAAPTSFLAGTAFNYVLSYLLAFRRGRFDRRHEVGRLAVVVVIGLVLNALVAAGFVQLGLSALLGKTLAVPCVLAWNFLGRRWLVFHAELPDTTWRWIQGPPDE